VSEKSLSPETSITKPPPKIQKEKTMKNRYSPKRPKPIGPQSSNYSRKFLFVSGQLAIDPKEGKIVATDIKGQTIRVLENIKAILNAANFNLSDIVQTNVYLSSMTLFTEFNSTYASYFGRDFPARVTVGIGLTPSTLEISVIAYKE
jgi:2-iminobutanoate/2-iminopropanoate deaminase